MNGGTPSTTTNVSKTELPAWVDAAGKANYDKAVALDNAPLQQYSGSTVAPTSAGTLAAQDYFNTNVNGAGAGDLSQASGLFKDIATKLNGPTPGMDDLGAASDIYKNLADPSKINAGVQSLLNPYIGEVETNALRANEDSRVKALMGNADSAIASKSFGGARSGIVDALTNAEAIKSAGDLSANIRKTGYDTATNTYLGSQGAAGSGLLNSGNSKMGGFFSGLDAMSGAASGLQGTGAQSFDQAMKTFTGMGTIGQQQQTQKQAEINADLAKFNEGRDKELNDLNLRMSALGMSPYSSSTSSSGTGTAATPGTDWAMTGMGLLSLFAGLSEDDEKEDVKKLGKVGNSDLDMYAFRYKGDPKSYPKVVGVMASDVEKKYPDRVTKVGGKRVIDYGLFSDIEAA